VRTSITSALYSVEADRLNATCEPNVSDAFTTLLSYNRESAVELEGWISQ
jgi:hypothetical protein